jgi:hypothetical protein
LAVGTCGHDDQIFSPPIDSNQSRACGRSRNLPNANSVNFFNSQTPEVLNADRVFSEATNHVNGRSLASRSHGLIGAFATKAPD